MINSYAFNTVPINGRLASIIPIAVGAGTLAEVAQYVGIQADGILLEVAQTVSLKMAAVGILCEVAREVTTATSSATLCSVARVVEVVSVSTYLSRRKWYALVYVNGVQIPSEQIQNIDVMLKEGEDSAVEISLVPAYGVQPTTEWEARVVKIYGIRVEDNSYTLMFTGQVAKVQHMPILCKTILSCTTMRQNTINQDQSLINVLPTIGYYTEQVFGQDNSTNGAFNELNNRISTIPYSFDYDPALNWRLTPLLAKSTPDHTLTTQDVYREGQNDPTVNTEAWGRQINSIEITARYKYSRAYQREMTFRWPGLTTFSTCEFLTRAYTVPTRSLIQQAVSAAGWPVTYEGIYFTPVLPAGYYTCGDGSVGWATGSTSVTQVAVVGDDGAIAKDVNGNGYYTSQIGGTVDYSATLCFGAEWRAATRWLQNIDEVYTITVKAPQIIAQYGRLVEEFDTVDVSSDYQGSQWETFTAYEPFPNVNGIPAWSYTTRQNGIDRYADIDDGISDFQQTQLLAISRAQSRLIRAQRSTKVTFVTKFWPQVTIFDTIKLDCAPKLQAHGKVTAIKHMMNAEGEANTFVELSLSKSTGSATTTALSVPARSTYSPTATTPTWAASTTRVAGDTIQPSPGNGYWYTCTVAGTNSTSQPAWPIPPSAIGTTVTDGSVTWSLSGQSNALVGQVVLQTHLAESPPPKTSTETTQPNISNGYIVNTEWNGFIGNGTTSMQLGGVTNYSRTTYPIQFIVDIPGINQSVRANAVVSSDATYNLAIQDDLLIVNFGIP